MASLATLPHPPVFTVDGEAKCLARRPYLSGLRYFESGRYGVSPRRSVTATEWSGGHGLGHSVRVERAQPTETDWCIPIRREPHLSGEVCLG